MTKHKPGDLFNAFQAKKKRHEEKMNEKKHMKRKKSYSEADMDSMKGYDPNLGLGRAGYAKATAVPKATNRPVRLGGMPQVDSRVGAPNFNSTRALAKPMLKKHRKHMKHMKHKKNWIAGAIKHPGALHRELGVKQGHKIPAKTLAKAANKGGVIGKRARLAETLKGFHHKHEKHEKHMKHHKHEKSKHCKTCSC